MLKKIGKTYHFRRAVPRGLRDSLGQTEFSISLKTQNRRTARSRAVVIYAEIDRVLWSGDDVKSKVDALARLRERDYFWRRFQEEPSYSVRCSRSGRPEGASRLSGMAGRLVLWRSTGESSLPTVS
ncbi:DUF6538 domain-containing protein [Gluconobacter morbifer]|uniref:DUF6538 domain-containing protein n=1 Tax=Gluconobacter morbifer TaxID=479935 RepID=UPI0038CDBDA4